MYLMRHYLPIVLLSAAVFSVGCVQPPNANSNAANASSNQIAAVPKKANDTAEELGLFVNFTWEPEDLLWKQDESKKTIVAVFRLDAEDVKKLSDQIASKSAGASKEVQVEDWFPAELIAQSESTGATSVDGTAFPADDFYQPPYSLGTITRVNGTDFFVIELAAN